jgi:hypothetical protein
MFLLCCITFHKSDLRQLDLGRPDLRRPDPGPEGSKRWTREGESEWEPIKILLEWDRGSNKMNMASNTRLRLNYPSWPRPRSHWSATGLRNLQPPSRTWERIRTPARTSLTYTGQAGKQHQSDRSLLVKLGNFHIKAPTPVKRCTSPVRPVQARKPQIYQTGLPSSKLTQTSNSSNAGQQRTYANVHPSKTQQESWLVRSVRGTGQTGVTWALGMNSTRGSTPPNPTPDLPNHSTDLCKTLGRVGTPHGYFISKIWSTKTCHIKRNRGNPTKNASNPRALKTPKSSSFAHGFGRGIKVKRSMKGSCIHPLPNPNEKGLEITPWKSPRKGSENRQK